MTSEPPTDDHRRRKPWLAALLSLLLPGLGHLYAGQPKRAAICYGLVALAAVTALVLLATYPLGPVTFPLAVVLAAGAYLWNVVHAAATARQASSAYHLKRYNRTWVYLVLVLGVGLAADLVRTTVRSKLVQAYRIPSPAMEPTVLPGDFLLASKWINPAQVEPGDLIVFGSPTETGITILKRVVGISGDTLEMNADTLYRNSRRVIEPYVARGDLGHDPADPRMRESQVSYLTAGNAMDYRPSLKNWGPIAVPEQAVFVLGDNRDNSYDSRFYGFVSWAHIQGWPTRIYFSYDRHGILPLPALTAIRWQRMGQRVR